MSLMKLSPESVRLRRIAKAFAAGEFSQQEYRSARREVIVNFVAVPVDDDDTQPREIITQSQPERRIDTVAPRRRLWLLTLLALGALVAASGVFAASSQIEAVRDRDPNPATSPRLEVTNVVLANFQPLPGISQEQVDNSISARLQQVRQRQQPAEHGFSDSELNELARLLGALGVHQADADLGVSQWEDVQALIAEQKTRRGVSVAELEEVAADIQSLYRAAGYFLAVAYLPAQNPKEGTVSIEVLPGVLGDVVVAGQGGKVAERFKDLIGQPLSSQVITTRLYALNQSPGLQAQVSFEPGEEVGETTLNLEVVPRKAWQGSVALDNYGDTGTGESRLLGDFSLLNPTGRGDVIDVGLMASLEGADQLYGYLGYSTPVAGRNQFHSRLAYTDFSTVLDSSDQRVDGDGLLYNVAFARSAVQTRERGLSYQLGGGYHRLNWDGDDLFADATQDVFFVNAQLNAQRVWDGPRIAADGLLRFEVGSIDNDTFAGQDSSYWLLNLEAFAWRPMDLPLLPGEQKISIEVQGQMADSQLPSSKRLALGGALANRAFRRDTYVVDQSALLRLDVRTPLSLGELSLFADAAYGETLNELDTNWGYLSGLGVAWSFRLAGIESRLSWAVPLASNGSGDIDDDGNQIFWSFSYRR
jgi:hemolysin activation/secretion protein